MTNRLFNPGHVVGRALMKMLVSTLDYQDQTQGRLYSFMAVKPLAKG